MSSSITESSVHEGKLLVHIAKNGNSFALDCDETTPVEGVMRFIESVSGINFNLCLDMKLESQHPLSAYKLPSTRLQENSQPPPPEQVDILEVADHPSPACPHDPHPLDDALDPALKALPSYEWRFRSHYHRGHAIYSRTHLMYEHCERLLREQKVQERAVEVASGNLDQNYRMISQNYSEFMKRYRQQHRMHSELLMNYRRDLEKLRSTKLHPALQTTTQKCLVDFVKEENLRKAVENCSNSHRQFEKKVLEFKQKFGEVKCKVKDKDVHTVKKLVGDCLSYQLSSSLRPHDAVSTLGPIYDVHDKNHLPNMAACGRSIAKLLEFCNDKKNEINIFLHNYMQEITCITYIIKYTKLKFPVFREDMVCQGDLFIDLRLLHGIGPAYRACLAEVVRRKASMKLYMGMAGRLNRREEFRKAHSSYLPRDILDSMGLYDIPSQCDVNIAPFDTNLLNIDISDLGHHAPDYLVGLPLKSKKHASLKGSFCMSNDSSHAAKTEEIVADTLDKDFSESLEGCDLNAKLKAELASAKALICSLSLEINAAEKTAEALHLKYEYGKHLHSMLNAKQLQCLSYEKRIQELEQRLSDHFLQGQKLSRSNVASDFDLPAARVGGSNSQIHGDGQAHVPFVSTSEPMDEVSCISSSLDAKLGLFTRQSSKGRDGGDENMMDSSGFLSTQLDSLMMDPHHEELQVSDKDGKDKMVGQLGMSLADSSTAEWMRALNVLLVTPSLYETESKLKAAMEDVTVLARELEMSQKLLDESQMNCAQLENCLHEAREEAQTHICAADRRASEFSALFATAVKMRGLFERPRSCVYGPGGVAGFADSLRALDQSMGNSINDNKDDGTSEFQKCIRVLADRVDCLSRHREELLDKYPKMEAANEQLRKELEETKELLTTVYKQHQLEKQDIVRAAREIAAFVLNSAAHYEAINRNSCKCHLSSESVALFTDHRPSPRPEHGWADPADKLTCDTGTDLLTLNLGSNSNPFSLPIGC
ncbi:hypothetical protein P3X46_031812 [Hevea brasiliensis]|uniref:Autophagy protein ATG17-like domain-containing protein n=1 Tax=Hevea brasiliensis TaxID=3981 RepID=A0ABQ9KN85_HEVBR|nr:hypothetical protein P3X46_031812 [Hevea brasiliensis]